jgi:hypothetical protein
LLPALREGAPIRLRRRRTNDVSAICLRTRVSSGSTACRVTSTATSQSLAARSSAAAVAASDRSKLQSPSAATQSGPAAPVAVMTALFQRAAESSRPLKATCRLTNRKDHLEWQRHKLARGHRHDTEPRRGAQDEGRHRTSDEIRHHAILVGIHGQKDGGRQHHREPGQASDCHDLEERHHLDPLSAQKHRHDGMGEESQQHESWPSYRTRAAPRAMSAIPVPITETPISVGVSRREMAAIEMKLWPSGSIAYRWPSREHV